MRDFMESWNNVVLSREMEAIVDGDVGAIEEMLDAGMSPNAQVSFEADRTWISSREGRYDALLAAFLAREFDVAKLLIDRGADLNADTPGYLFRAIEANSPEMFCYVLDNGFNLEDTSRAIWLLFHSLNDLQDPVPFLEAFEALGLSYAQKGGEALRSSASAGDLASVEFLIDHGVDIDYHDADMVYPYASTPLIEAARHGQGDVVRYLVAQGADLFITDKYGDRPYTAALTEHYDEIARYIRELEPAPLHDIAQKDKELRRYKLPADMVTFLKEGPRHFEFPSGKWAKWIEFYEYADTVEITWHRCKFLSFVREIDNYGSGYAIAWHAKDKMVWCIDWEHDEAYPIAPWDSFIADPGSCINGIFNGDHL